MLVVMGAVFIAVFAAVWWCFIFMFLIGCVNLYRGVFYLRKANELDELDRTNPIVVSQPTQYYSTPIQTQAVYANPIYSQQQQPQYVQPTYYSQQQQYSNGYPSNN
jgi:hypothetical protein